MLQNCISLGLFLTCFLIFIHKSRRGWITFQSWASIPAFHWPCSLWMKTMLKSFIRKTRGENQQHSERGKNSWIAEKKLEKKKKPATGAALLTEDPLLPLAKELFCDQERADDFSLCSFTARLTASWKILPLLFIFYYLFAGLFFSFFRRFCDCLLLLDVFVIIFFVLFTTTRTASQESCFLFASSFNSNLYRVLVIFFYCARNKFVKDWVISLSQTDFFFRLRKDLPFRKEDMELPAAIIATILFVCSVVYCDANRIKRQGNFFFIQMLK